MSENPEVGDGMRLRWRGMSVEERREALIEAAYQVIADHGQEGATRREGCARQHAAGQLPLSAFES